MDIIELKTSIENKTLDDGLIIFVCKDNFFVPHQYVKEISLQKDKTIDYLDSIENLISGVPDIFGVSEVSEGIRVFSCDELTNLNKEIRFEKDLYIITKKIDKVVKDEFKEFIVEVPKLENWQIKDYVYSNLDGIDTKELDWLIDVCGFDIYRLDNEISKLKLFSETERKYVFDSMKNEGAYSDLSAFNVFNITNAVTSKDINLLLSALKEIKSFDAEPLGVVTLLYQGFKKLIQVWLAKNPTPENTGLKSNVIYAISKSPRVYDKSQLLKCFLEMTDIDRKLKTGQIEIPWLIDYSICKVLTC